MKLLLILATLFAGTLQAQPLTFNKRFVECENHWVVFPPKDSAYDYGFIYIDTQAGLTLEYQGKFTISPDGSFVQKLKMDSGKTGNVKIRLKPNNVRVAFFPASRYGDLHLTETPDWLKFYQTDTNSVARLFRWGFLYNSWNESAKALTYLQRAQAIDPTFKGLQFELGYAYNALQQYDKAIPVLENALQTAPKDCNLYKELSFAQMHLAQLDKAAESCQKGIEYCTDKAMKAEIAYNLTYQYYLVKDKAKFATWAGEVRKWATPGDVFSTNLQKMEAGQ